jgi:hypothetical protein
MKSSCCLCACPLQQFEAGLSAGQIDTDLRLNSHSCLQVSLRSTTKIFFSPRHISVWKYALFDEKIWKPKEWRQKRRSLLATARRQWIRTQQSKNCWISCFWCDPCRIKFLIQFFFRFPNLFASCTVTFKYTHQIVCWEARAGRGVLCSTPPW